jgi:hypothetical protein
VQNLQIESFFVDIISPQKLAQEVNMEAGCHASLIPEKSLLEPIVKFLNKQQISILLINTESRGLI